MYQPLSVWQGIMDFRDHDEDRNLGTDWISQSEVFERKELSYFNRTHKSLNETVPKSLTSNYIGWGSGEPNDKDGSENSEEDCTTIRTNGDWNDQTCSDRVEALCEFQDGSYSTTGDVTWNVANLTCHSRGGYLAVIDSSTENTDIASQYGKKWIGYYQDQSSNPNNPNENWKWVNSSGTYKPKGYATEDDCGPLLRKSQNGPCSEVGDNEQHKAWMSSSNFSLGGSAP